MLDTENVTALAIVSILRVGPLVEHASSIFPSSKTYHFELFAMELAEEVSERKAKGESEEDKHVAVSNDCQWR
ncbi:hypothetical protein C5167_026920 [Papaver somniferum]|nr:hypothetical protein C5167_026920 [Papaver somniferum]